MFYAILSAQNNFHPKFFWVKQGATQCYQAFLVYFVVFFHSEADTNPWFCTTSGGNAWGPLRSWRRVVGRRASPPLEGSSSSPPDGVPRSYTWPTGTSAVRLKNKSSYQRQVPWYAQKWERGFALDFVQDVHEQGCIAMLRGGGMAGTSVGRLDKQGHLSASRPRCHAYMLGVISCQRLQQRNVTQKGRCTFSQNKCKMFPF